MSTSSNSDATCMSPLFTAIEQNSSVKSSKRPRSDSNSNDNNTVDDGVAEESALLNRSAKIQQAKRQADDSVIVDSDNDASGNDDSDNIEDRLDRIEKVLQQYRKQLDALVPATGQYYNLLPPEVQQSLQQLYEQATEQSGNTDLIVNNKTRQCHGCRHRINPKFQLYQCVQIRTLRTKNSPCGFKWCARCLQDKFTGHYTMDYYLMNCAEIEKFKCPRCKKLCKCKKCIKATTSEIEIGKPNTDTETTLPTTAE
jgi:hypothetical protein